MTEVLGTIQNPYHQPIEPTFGLTKVLPNSARREFEQVRGNPVFSMNPSLQYPPPVKPGQSVTKAGVSNNQDPEPVPWQYLNIKFPQYSTLTHAFVDQPRIGTQLGMSDVYRDSPYQDWTTGIQYYTIYTGDNLKTRVSPLIYPQAYRPEIWAQPTVDFPQVNKQKTNDATFLDMDFSCKACEVASAGLATPVAYAPRNSSAPLPVALYPGESLFNTVGYYTGRELGKDSRSWPPPANPIVETERQVLGLPTIPIRQEYDAQFKSWVQHGFSFD